MVVKDQIIALLREILSLSDAQAERLAPESGLLGEIAEFDSMAVVSVITGIEAQFGFNIDDDDISADNFATVGTLVAYVEARL